MFSHADLQRENPMRPLDWQWQRAKSLVADRRRYRPDCDDAATEMAVKFLRTRRRWGNNKLGQEMPDVSHAVQLHEQNSSPAWLIESRSLARQSPREIAALLSVSVASVAIYEKLFFDISDRLDARAYVSKQAIGLTGDGTCDNLHPAAVLKWFGYFGGPVVLDVVAPIILDAGSTVHTEPVFAAKTKLLASLLTLPLDEETSFKLLPACLQLVESTRVGGSDSESSLAGVSEQTIDQVTELLNNRAVEDAVETDMHTDVDMTESDTWEAA